MDFAFYLPISIASFSDAAPARRGEPALPRGEVLRRRRVDMIRAYVDQNLSDPDLAARKVQIAEDLWNTRDPQRVAAAYTEDSEWRNRTDFLRGRDAIIQFLRRKWNRELDYKLKKELWGFRNNRMAVKFEYEWHDDSGNWFRSYGNENWEFNADGRMQKRYASINDLPIRESDRKYHWPLGRRPDEHPGLSQLDL